MTIEYDPPSCEALKSHNLSRALPRLTVIGQLNTWSTDYAPVHHGSASASTKFYPKSGLHLPTQANLFFQGTRHIGLNWKTAKYFLDCCMRVSSPPLQVSSDDIEVTHHLGHGLIANYLNLSALNGYAPSNSPTMFIMSSKRAGYPHVLWFRFWAAATHGCTGLAAQ